MSPMLKARYQHSGTWRRGEELWLSAAQTRIYVAKRDIRSSHRAFREHWEASAAMQFQDEQLSLFGTTDGLSEDLTYLVWRSNAAEPEVWSYHGWDEHHERDLEHYLTWRLKRR